MTYIEGFFFIGVYNYKQDCSDMKIIKYGDWAQSTINNAHQDLISGINLYESFLLTTSEDAKIKLWAFSGDSFKLAFSFNHNRKISETVIKEFQGQKLVFIG